MNSRRQFRFFSRSNHVSDSLNSWISVGLIPNHHMRHAYLALDNSLKVHEFLHELI